MSDPTLFQFQEDSVPRAYDTLLVPRFFNQFGEHLLSLTGVAIGDAVLDVATGPGTLARQASARVGPSGRVVGADISAAMLSVARLKSTPVGGVPVEWVESPAAPLAVPDASFDAVVCHQGLQFFPDRAAALHEMRRALKPGGWLGVGVWGPLARNTWAAALLAAFEESGLPAFADKMRAPWAWSDPGDLATSLRAAGFRDVHVTTVTLPVVFEGGVEQVLEIHAATPIAPEIAALARPVRQALDAAFRRRLAPLVEGTRVRASMESNIAVARR